MSCSICHNLTITFSGATYAVAGVLALTGVEPATP